MKEDMGRIAGSVNKMQILFGDLLELSRIGRIMNQSEAVAFEEIVLKAEEPLRGKLDEGNISFILNQDLPSVYGDKQRLVEVIQDLVDNATKLFQPASGTNQ